MFSAALRHARSLLRLRFGGADVVTVAGILGHSQPSTTLDIYTHAFDKNKKAVSAKLQKGLEIWNALIGVVQLDYSHNLLYLKQVK